MDINALIPPVLVPYKAWIVLALFVVVYIVRPSMPTPQANSSAFYVFVFNVLDKIAGNYAGAAHTQENIPVTAPAAVTAGTPKPETIKP